MINSNNSFQIILILSAICISFTWAIVDEQRLNQCKEGMVKAFGPQLDKPPIEYIKYAITSLQRSVDKFEYDASDYYNLFNNAIDIIGEFELPTEFCLSRTEGLREIRFVGEKASPRLLEFNRCKDALYGFGVNIEGRNELETVLCAVIYHQKISTDERLRGTQYVHFPGSYGFTYINIILERIEFIEGKLDTPNGYCEHYYNNDNTSISEKFLIEDEIE